MHLKFRAFTSYHLEQINSALSASLFPLNAIYTPRVYFISEKVKIYIYHYIESTHIIMFVSFAATTKKI